MPIKKFAVTLGKQPLNLVSFSLEFGFSSFVFFCVFTASANGQLEILQMLVDAGVNLSPSSADDEGNVAIHAAVSNNQYYIVQFLLQLDQRMVNFENKMKQTPCWLAAYYGFISVTRVLKAKGCNLNGRDNSGWTPLMAACSNNKVTMVKFLISEAHSDVEATSHLLDDRNNCLHIACINNSFEVVEFLLKYRPSLKSTSNSKNRTALWLSSFYGHLNIVRFLIGKLDETDTSKADSDGYTPLMAAVSEKHLTVAKMLVKFGASVTTRSQDGKDQQAIHFAAQNGDAEMVRYLVMIDRSLLDSVDSLGETPLYKAAALGHFSVVQFFVSNNAKVDAANVEGETPLLAAIEGGHENVVTFLLGNGAHVGRIYNGRTPLLLASINSSLNVIKALLNGGAEILARSDFVDDQGGTSVHMAAAYGNYDAIFLYIAKDQRLMEIKNHHGETPLFCAIRNKHVTIAERLIRLGANVNAQDNDGNTPFLLACSSGIAEITNLLIGANARIDVKNYLDENGVHLGARGGHLDIVKLIMNKYYWLVEQPNKNGEKPIHLAAANGQVNVLDHFLYLRVRIDDYDNDGKRPIHSAAANGQSSCIKSLLNHGSKIQWRMKNSGDMPIHLVAAIGHITSMVLLLGVNRAEQIESKNNKLETPLFIAAANGHAPLVSYLMSINANMETRNDRQLTPLMIATINGHLDTVIVLAENGALLTAQSGTQDGRKTCIHFAVHQGHIEMVRYFLTLKDGLLLEAGNSLGASPLSEASAEGKVEIVNLLIHFGADLNKRTLNNLSPIWRAANGGHTEIVKALADAGADVESMGYYDRTPLLQAAGSFGFIFNFFV